MMTVWYGKVCVNLYSAIVANVSNALGTLVPGKQPSFQALFERSNCVLENTGEAGIRCCIFMPPLTVDGGGITFSGRPSVVR